MRNFVCGLVMLVGAVLVIVPIIGGVWKLTVEETVPVYHIFQMVCAGGALVFLGWFFKK